MKVIHLTEEQQAKLREAQSIVDYANEFAEKARKGYKVVFDELTGPLNNSAYPYSNYQEARLSDDGKFIVIQKLKF